METKARIHGGVCRVKLKATGEERREDYPRNPNLGSATWSAVPIIPLRDRIGRQQKTGQAQIQACQPASDCTLRAPRHRVCQCTESKTFSAATCGGGGGCGQHSGREHDAPAFC